MGSPKRQKNTQTTMNHQEATQAALSIMRRGEPFQWYVITLLMMVF